MYWNYRVVENGNGTHSIRAIVYDDQEQPVAWFPKTVAPAGEDREAFIEDLDHYTRASFSSVMSIDEFEELEQLSRAPKFLGVEWKD